MAAPTTDLARQREQLEHRATALFVGFLVAIAVVCAGIIVSGWFAGALDDPPERVFWTGAVLSGLTVAVLAVGAFPGGVDDRREVVRLRWTMRLGLALAVVGPALCIGALIADFFL
jgi:hypothetical protein